MTEKQIKDRLVSGVKVKFFSLILGMDIFFHAN